MSALWDLPAILVCENNHYGMGTADWRAAKLPECYKRGDYIPGLKVDGMDPLSVKQACKFAKEYVLKNGPMVLDMDYYRYHGHSMSDPRTTYRKRDEIDRVRKERDPIERARQLLLTHELATEQELKAELWWDFPFWPDDGMCRLHDCSICECSKNEFPETSKKQSHDDISKDHFMCQEGKPHDTFDRTLNTRDF